MKLISLMPLNIREAEKKKDEKPADDKEAAPENPFATTTDDGSDTEAPDKEDPSTKTDKEEEEGSEASSKEGSLEISFNPSRVRKYNDVPFKGNVGTVIGVSRYGIAVKLPSEGTIFVNFDDIL